MTQRVGADLSRMALSALLALLLFGADPPVVLVCGLVVLASVAASVFDPAYNAAVPTIVADELLPAANGLNMANGAVGGLVGPLAGGALIAVADIVLARGRLALPFHVLGVCLAVVGVVPLVGAAAALVVGGVAIAVANTEAMTRFQRSVPSEVQGRVFGVLGSLSEGLRPAGLALGAPLLAVGGVSGAFVVVGGGVVLAALVFARDAAPAQAIRVPQVHPGVPGTLG